MSGASLDQRFAEAMGQLLGPDFPTDIALAVSGGGDSMAMLTLAHNWAHVWGVRLWVVTVDHGLRPESAAEAAMVAEESAALGHPHATLRWHWDGQGNLMDAARRGRLKVIDRWREGIGHVLFAHTRDDVAETFVMRLMRGSGVDGLSAMQAAQEVRPHRGGKRPMAARDVCWTAAPPLPDRFVAGARAYTAGFRLLRPCLDMRRAELRHYLRTLKGRWIEDPTNDDPRFDRARVRQAGAALEALGLDTDTLAATAARMARAQGALRARAVQIWTAIGQEGRAGAVPTGEILFDREGFAQTERDTQLRLLAAALQYVASAEYRPRAAPLDALLDRLLGGGGGTLHGAEARAERDVIRVFREYAALVGTTAQVGDGTRWDGRWRVFHPAIKGLTIRALGEDGWSQVPEKPDGAIPFHAAKSLPSVWDGDRLVACDALDLCPDAVAPARTTRLEPMGQEGMSFAGFLLSH